MTSDALGGTTDTIEKPQHATEAGIVDQKLDTSAHSDISKTRHGEGVSERRTSSRFHFKGSNSQADRTGGSKVRTRQHHHRSRHHHHRSRRERTSKPLESTAGHDGTGLPDSPPAEFIDPDIAFRESLFDAMADDEGLAFWEGVYGQPIPFERVQPTRGEGPQGILESMTDEEYVAHIREEMYKKTHQHLLEEKERREEAKKERIKLAEKARIEAEDMEKFNSRVEESLRRGQERRARQKMTTEWSNTWRTYEKAWNELGKSSIKVPWPVWGGSQSDIEASEIKRFFLNGPTAGDPRGGDLRKTIKHERVRWHPDKVQQKLGGQGADRTTMEGVTAVFQIIDRMWSELREQN